MSSHPIRFRHTALRGMVLAALAASGEAHAVFEDPHGVGQALIYPYYTVQTANGNSFNTYLSVVNTTTRPKAVKVRFREGKNARTVLDFNLYLSPNDVWTAALGPADATPASPATLYTHDKSCTAPPIPVEGVAFRNYAYAGALGDAGPTTLDRTREGYFEIIEMANLTGPAATAVTHTAAGTPANCAVVQPTNGYTAASNAASLQPPSGGLTGTYTLINVSNGLNFGGNATALAHFSATPIFGDLGGDFPDLGSANPPKALTVADDQSVPGAPTTAAYAATYASGRDAVSAALMRSAVLNEFALDTATQSATDWVVTTPTRHLHAGSGGSAASAPFSAPFNTLGACENIAVTYFNREELGATIGEIIILPPPPSLADVALCYAASVFAISTGPQAATSLVLGSRNVRTIPASGTANGRIRMSFSSAAAATGISSMAGSGTLVNAGTGAVTAGTTVKLRGLPVVGFMARTLNNGTLSCTTFGAPGTCAGAYGSAYDHQYHLIATPAP